MGKLSDLIVAENRATGPRCTVAIALATLPRDVVADLRAAMADAAVTSSGISRALAKLGHSLSPYTLQRHRRGECGCGKTS